MQALKRLPKNTTFLGLAPLEAAKQKGRPENVAKFNAERHSKLLSEAASSGILKKCRNCGKTAISIGDLEAFVPYNRGFLGRDNLCKECKRKQSRQRYYENPEPFNARAREFQEKHADKKSAGHKRYVKEFPEKIQAEKKAQLNIKIDKPCVVCGSTENLQRHHPDYSKPLEVVILCPACHGKIHRKGAL